MTAVTVSAADLRTVQQHLHHHQRPWIWDADNPPGALCRPAVDPGCPPPLWSDTPHVSPWGAP